MNKRRLRTLANYLRTLPQKSFNIKEWGNTTDCRTVACAGGHATLIPSFRRAGLKNDKDCNPKSQNLQPVFQDESGFEALMLVFDLDRREVYHIFDSDEYQGERSVTPKTVAKRIEDLIGPSGTSARPRPAPRSTPARSGRRKTQPSEA